MAFGAHISLDDVAKMRRQIIWALWVRGRPPLEGSASSEELLYLAEVARRTNARIIGEIGFNAGFSAQAFLNASPSSQVISFDLVEHGYTRVAKKLVDAKFPGRHTLIKGDSTKTVPEFKLRNSNLTFDLVFIDGGHAYEVARADLQNMMSLSHSKTAVVIDDLTPWYRWGKGPTRAWCEAIRDGIIQQDELFNDGKSVDGIAPPGRRVWALGRYVTAAPVREGL
jgi:hypothetical protein